jgi:hypothetical protein
VLGAHFVANFVGGEKVWYLPAPQVLCGGVFLPIFGTYRHHGLQKLLAFVAIKKRFATDARIERGLGICE